MSAARNQWISPLSAFSITSCTVIARSHAACGYPMEPPGSALGFPQAAK